MKRALGINFALWGMLFCLCMMVQPANAQSTVVSPCGTLGQAYAVGTVRNPTVDVNGLGCVSASVSASISGFAPATTGTPISVTTGGVTGTLPAGAVVVAFNTGTTNTAYCKLGGSATTSDIAIQPGSWFAYTVGGATQLTCITSTSTTTVNMIGGAGLPTGAGGGGGGGAAGTVAQGNAGSNAQAWWTQIGDTARGPVKVQAGNAAAVADVALTVSDPNVLAAIQSSIPAGSAIIGKVGFDQTTPGTTNAVSATNFPTTVDTNSGNKSASTIRQTLATDQLALATWGQGATGAAPPSGATQMGTVQSGATGGFLKAPIVCDNYVYKHITSATDTLAVQGVASQTVYVCGYEAFFAGTATFFLENTASTNANCSSSNTQIAILVSGTAQSGIVSRSPFWNGLKNTSGNGLCINSTGTGGFDIGIYYAQF